MQQTVHHTYHKFTNTKEFFDHVDDCVYPSEYRSLTLKQTENRIKYIEHMISAAAEVRYGDFAVWLRFPHARYFQKFLWPFTSIKKKCGICGDILHYPRDYMGQWQLVSLDNFAGRGRDPQNYERHDICIRCFNNERPIRKANQDYLSIQKTIRNTKEIINEERRRIAG